MRDNITFGGGELTDEEVERFARAAQAHEFIEKLPEGYDTVIGERGITLSGGQRQRIAIARALAVDPRILILDDATASVDATTEARIRAGLREAMRGRTTLIIAHRLSTIALADEVVVLDHGRVAARGTHDQLVESSPVYREIYEHGLLEQQFVDAVEARARWRKWHEGPPARRPSDARARREGRRLVLAQDAQADGAALAPDEALPEARRVVGALAADGDGDRARPSLSGQVRAGRRGQRQHDGSQLYLVVGDLPRRRDRELRHVLRRDVHDRLGR